MKLYHCSKKKGLEWLRPFPHPLFKNRKVVFATPDKKFALAMSYGTGYDLAFGYYENTKTKEKQCYLDELKPNALKLLESQASLYIIDGIGFESNKKLMKEELISKTKVKVLREIRIDNVLNKLKRMKIKITGYDYVLDAMKLRNKDPKKPKNKRTFKKT